MSEQLRRQNASTADYSSVDTIIEEKVKEGQIAGFDLFTKDEQEQALLELAQLYPINQIAYEQQRNKLQDWFGCTKAAIDTEVKRFVDRNKPPALPKPEDNPVNELVAIAKREVLWRYNRTAYVSFDRDGHIENHKIDSDDFEDFLADKYGEEHQREINGNLEPCYPTREDLKKAIRQIQAYGRRGPEREPRIRVTEYEGEVWIDLGTPEWSAVVINADEPRIEKIMKAPLVRGAGMRPLPIPVKGGNIQELRGFINVRDDAEDEFALLCGSIAAMLNPFGNYLTYLLSGPPNSAKTTITKIMRAIADPHQVGSRFIAGVRDLWHGAEQTHIIGIENRRHLSQEWSDAICSVNTGTGYAERQLFTQGREYMTYVHCPVIINGIPANLAEQPDLIDRIITVRFDYLGDRVRSEKVFWDKFNLAAPRIFGALLDGLVGAVKVLKDFGGDTDEAAKVLLSGWRPRFVDAAVWPEAACRAMGFKPGEFVEAYKNNKDVAFRELAETEQVCIGIRKSMAKRNEWKGYPQQLCAAIEPYVVIVPNGVWLARTLPLFIPALDKVYGIQITMNNRLFKDDNRNGIIITKTGLGAGGRYFPDSQEASGKEEIPTPISSSTKSEEGPVIKKGFSRRL